MQLFRAAFFSLAILFVASLSLADDPVNPPKPDNPQPAPIIQPVSIIAPKDVTGTGTREDPFVFTPQTKCLLTLSADIKLDDWDTADAPSDIEPIGRSLIFSHLQSGSFQVIAKAPYARCWFVLKSGADPPGPNNPPTPEDAAATLKKRVQSALTGNPADAAKFGTVCDELAKALDKNQIATLADLESKMKAGLDAAMWAVGKYPDLSKLAGELFGAGIIDRTLTSADKLNFSKSLKQIAAACQGVK